MTRRADNLGELSDEALMCRDLRHSWRLSDQRVTGGPLVRELVCSRCGTVRRDEFSWPGLWLLRSTYTYPDDYCFAPQAEPRNLRIRDIRKHWFERHNVKGEGK